ncbi:MAG: outer membrane beta-barrel protein [Gammaproteobacteria bacterium]|nr:outer membrane beta-barrel protein [Gammaproteobacteria bacterium]
MKKLMIAGSLTALMAVSTAVCAAPNYTYYNSSAQQGQFPATTRQLYGSLILGGNALQDQYWADTDVPLGSTFKYKFGGNIGGSLGIKMGNWRSELQMIYMQNKINSIDGNALSGALSGTNMSALAVMVNFIHDFHIDEHWVPYLGLGIGVMSFNFNNDDNGLVDGTQSSAFGYQSILGVGYQINKNIRLFGEFHHIASSSVTEKFYIGPNTTTDFDTYYQNNLFDVGAAFFFDV